MFHLYDFLIYCFITAYTPGANNLLSMSNAIRMGFRRSIRFNIGILAGFAVVMSVCTAFSAALYSLLPSKDVHADSGSCLHAVSGMESLEEFCGFGCRCRK